MSGSTLRGLAREDMTEEARARVNARRANRAGHLEGILAVGDRVAWWWEAADTEYIGVVNRLLTEGNSLFFALAGSARWWNTIEITTPLPPLDLEAYDEWHARYFPAPAPIEPVEADFDLAKHVLRSTCILCGDPIEAVDPQFNGGELASQDGLIDSAASPPSPSWTRSGAAQAAGSTPRTSTAGSMTPSAGSAGAGLVHAGRLPRMSETSRTVGTLRPTVSMFRAQS